MLFQEARQLMNKFDTFLIEDECWSIYSWSFAKKKLILVLSTVKCLHHMDLLGLFGWRHKSVTTNSFMFSKLAIITHYTNVIHRVRIRLQMVAGAIWASYKEDCKLCWRGCFPDQACAQRLPCVFEQAAISKQILMQAVMSIPISATKTIAKFNIFDGYFLKL